MKQNPIFPSILSTNYFNLESRLEIFSSCQIEFIHLDIMDGHFVDNLSFGPSSAKSIKERFEFKLDTHLMVSNPAKIIPKFLQAGSDWVSFHIEAVDSDREISNLIQLIKENHRQAGLVLNPDTPVEDVFPYLGEVDYILLMSVFPGYGGQKFISATVDRVAQLKKHIVTHGYNCLIQVDGGVNSDNIEPLRVEGADLFVIGTFLFNAEDIPKTIFEIQKKITA